MRRPLNSAGRVGRLVLILGGLVMAACQQPPAAPTNAPPPAAAPEVGTISFALTLGSGYRFDKLSYSITRGAYHLDGDVNSKNSATFSALISNIPFGTGYVAKLTTNDVLHQLMPCEGSAMFDITSTAPVSVPVHMTCHPIIPPPPVPVPRGAVAALALSLLALGVFRAGRRPSTNERNTP
jgi:hypothetical protein